MVKFSNPWLIVKEYEPEINQQLLNQFHGERDGYVQVGPKRYCFTKRFAVEGADYYHFEPRSTDTWIVTFPRSGTTLTQELVWILANDFNFNEAAEKPLTQRFPFLEFSTCVNEKWEKDFISAVSENTTRTLVKNATASCLPSLAESRGPRFIKTHLPLSLLHPDLLTCGAKVLYVARNPKDVAISYYHLHKLFKTLDYKGTFQDFWNHFENDRLLWSPYWEHINEGWSHRHQSNLLFLFYEELQQNMEKSIGRIASFLGVYASSSQIKELADHLEITRFKNNPSVNMHDLRLLGILNKSSQGFIRNGKHYSTIKQDEDILKFPASAESWINDNLKKVDFRFP